MVTYLAGIPEWRHKARDEAHVRATAGTSVHNRGGSENRGRRCCCEAHGGDVDIGVGRDGSAVGWAAVVEKERESEKESVKVSMVESVRFVSLAQPESGWMRVMGAGAKCACERAGPKEKNLKPFYSDRGPVHEADVRCFGRSGR